MWNDIGQLKYLSAWLQWSSIALVFISGALQLAKYTVDSRKDGLAAIEQRNLLDPIKQQIHGGTAVIEIQIKTDKTFHNHFMDSGAYVAFGHGSTALLTMTSIDSFARTNGEGTAIFRATVTLDASDPANGKPVAFLKGADYVQIQFGQLTSEIAITSGKIIFTFNNAARLEVNVPPQQVSNGIIMVRDLSSLKARLAE